MLYMWRHLSPLLKVIIMTLSLIYCINFFVTSFRFVINSCRYGQRRFFSSFFFLLFVHFFRTSHTYKQLLAVYVFLNPHHFDIYCSIKNNEKTKTTNAWIRLQNRWRNWRWQRTKHCIRLYFPFFLHYMDTIIIMVSEEFFVYIFLIFFLFSSLKLILKFTSSLTSVSWSIQKIHDSIMIFFVGLLCLCVKCETERKRQSNMYNVTNLSR